MKRFLTLALAALSLLAPAPAVRAADKTPLASYPGEPNQPLKTGDAVPVTHGGTGAITLTSHCVLVGVGTSAVHLACPSTAGQVMTDNGASADPSFQAAAGGGGTPGGSSGQIQYNNAGAFAGGAVSGDCTAVILAFTCTKLNSVSPGYFFDGTDASHLTGTLGLARLGSQSANVVLAGPTSGGSATPSFRALVAADIPALAYAPQTSGSSLLYGNGSGGFSSASVGAGLAFSGGVLSNTGSGGSASWTANPFCATAGGSNPCIRYGNGAPSATTDPIGSFYIDATTPALYQQVTPSATPAYVQAKSFIASSVTLTAAPTAGNLMVGFCWQGMSVNTGGGWTDASLNHNASVFDLALRVGYKYAVSGESATQTPCTGSFAEQALVEISGVPTWAAGFEGWAYAAQNFGGVATTVSYTTTNANDLVVGAYAIANGSVISSLAVTGTVTANPTTAYGTNAAAQNAASGSTAQIFAAAGAQTATATFNNGQAASGALLSFKPATPSYRRIDAASITAANPTATASDTAVNGSSTSYMRADASPAVQKATTSQFGLVKPDGSTITIASGVISAVGTTGAAISGTPTAGNCTSWLNSTTIQDAGAACVGGGGSGALVLLEQHTASSSATLDFTTAISATYDEYVIDLVGLVPATNAVSLYMRVSTNGGSTYDSGANYSSIVLFGSRFGATGAGADSGATQFTMNTDSFDNTAGNSLSGSIRLFHPASTSLYKTINGHIEFVHSGSIEAGVPSGAYRSTTAVNAFRFLFSSGNIASGIIRVYGVAK